MVSIPNEGKKISSFKNFPTPFRWRISRLYALGDQGHDSNVGTVFAQFSHLKLTSLYKNPSMVNMRAQHQIPLLLMMLRDWRLRPNKNNIETTGVVVVLIKSFIF